jgi:hypothetical protein
MRPLFTVPRVAAALAVVAVSACATEPPYGPKAPGHTSGYTDQRLGPNRYRVTYTGSTLSSRATVENYLLLRAAQVTLDAGYDFFAFDARDTKRDTRYYTDFDPWPGWHGYGWYWHSWAFGPPFPPETQAISRYEAYSEIVMLTPEQAKNDPHAVDAHDVVAHLTPAPPPA